MMPGRVEAPRILADRMLHMEDIQDMVGMARGRVVVTEMVPELISTEAWRLLRDKEAAKPVRGIIRTKGLGVGMGTINTTMGLRVDLVEAILQLVQVAEIKIAMIEGLLEGVSIHNSTKGITQASITMVTARISTTTKEIISQMEIKRDTEVATATMVIMVTAEEITATITTTVLMVAAVMAAMESMEEVLAGRTQGTTMVTTRSIRCSHMRTTTTITMETIMTVNLPHRNSINNNTRNQVRNSTKICMDQILKAKGPSSLKLLQMVQQTQVVTHLQLPSSHLVVDPQVRRCINPPPSWLLNICPTSHQTHKARSLLIPTFRNKHSRIQDSSTTTESQKQTQIKSGSTINTTR